MAGVCDLINLKEILHVSYVCLEGALQGPVTFDCVAVLLAAVSLRRVFVLVGLEELVACRSFLVHNFQQACYNMRSTIQIT